jgi:hypothetical protein
MVDIPRDVLPDSITGRDPMIYARWLGLCLLDWVLLITVPFAAPVIAAFTRAEPHDNGPYSWGGMWGTYDNPPQGDEGYVRKRCLFPGVTAGLRGYINRVQWMLRNPLYGFARWAALEYRLDTVHDLLGKDGISDKDGIPGWYLVRVRQTKSRRVVGFEFYGVFPYSKTRNVRIRMGWKILTDKFQRNGFAQLVNTINPFDGYNNG